MNNVKEEMMKIYNTYTLDWMNYFVKENDITYHHIVKAEDGGRVTIDNGALLTQRAHNYLHTIERIDIDIYNRINTVLKEINESKQEPTRFHRQRIELLLYEFEVKNANKLIKSKEKTGKKRIITAHKRRIKSQMGYHNNN